MSEDHAGAAHPLGVVVTLTFDLRTGRRYALADLFAPGARYLESLSRMSRELLAEELGPDADPQSVAEGTAPRPPSPFSSARWATWPPSPAPWPGGPRGPPPSPSARAPRSPCGASGRFGWG
jgi:hypothetical protein